MELEGGALCASLYETYIQWEEDDLLLRSGWITAGTARVIYYDLSGISIKRKKIRLTGWGLDEAI